MVDAVLLHPHMCSSVCVQVVKKNQNTSAALSFVLLITLELFDFRGRGKTCISGACLKKSKILHSESIEPITYSDAVRLVLPQLHRDLTDMPSEPPPSPSFVPLK